LNAERSVGYAHSKERVNHRLCAGGAWSATAATHIEGVYSCTRRDARRIPSAWSAVCTRRLRHLLGRNDQDE